MQTTQDVVKINLLISPAFKNQHVSIEPTSIILEIPLIDGSHIIKSAPVRVGNLINFGNPPIFATFTLWYQYDCIKKFITVCSDDLISQHSAHITTYADGLNQACVQHSYDVDIYQDELNKHWNHNSILFPGLGDSFRQTLKAANLMIRKSLIDANLNLNVRSRIPDISEELYLSLCTVHYKGSFFEMYDPSKIYGKEYTLQVIDSTGYGVTQLSSNQAFANVIGSTNDPKIGGSSWIALWTSQFGANRGCTSYNIAGIPGGGVTNFLCTTGNLVYGGHVLLGQFSESLHTGSNVVMIIPICPAHNNDDSVYMEAIRTNKAITLQNYLN
jgi:hypothetical protein